MGTITSQKETALSASSDRALKVAAAADGVAVAAEFSELTSSDIKKLDELGEQADQCAKRSVLEMVKLASHVAAAHELLKNKGCESQFGRWYSEYLPDFGKTTIYRLLKMHLAFGDVGSSVLAQFDVTALYTLSSQVEARELALSRAEKGQRVRNSDAKKLVEMCCPRTKEDSGNSSTGERFKTVHGLVEVSPQGGNLEVVKALREAIKQVGSK